MDEVLNPKKDRKLQQMKQKEQIEKNTGGGHFSKIEHI
tara:strand:- start:922 stop:1035 length:114 start_codon:yes stop_codon:yes gene_type:complete